MNDHNQEPAKSPVDSLTGATDESIADSEQQERRSDGNGDIASESTSEHTNRTGRSDNQEIKDIWPQLRLLLVFQIKLYIDAARDLLMSPLSVVVFIIDAVQGNRGEKSLFESLLQFGRRTEKAINLFNQHDVNDENYRGIDSILMQVEDAVRKEYTDGSVSANARDSIEKSLDRLRSKLNQSKQDNE